MNIYENMSNKRKMVEKIRRVCTTLPKCQLLTFLDYQTCYQIKVETIHVNPVVRMIYKLSNLHIHEY